jgi:hypothetical protein
MKRPYFDAAPFRCPHSIRLLFLTPSLVRTLRLEVTLTRTTIALADSMREGPFSSSPQLTFRRHVRKLPASLRRSLTWGRGLEMAKHKTQGRKSCQSEIAIMP